MTKQSSRTPSTSRSSAPARPWAGRLLSLSLVPIVAGILLIAAWALDINIIGPLDSQPLVGLFFVLLGFVMSNAFQQLWRLALGWALIAVADILLLVPAPDIVRYAALATGAIGLGLLIAEIVARLRQAQQTRP